MKSQLFDKGCVTSDRLKWGNFYPNDVDGIIKNMLGEGQEVKKLREGNTPHLSLTISAEDKLNMRSPLQRIVGSFFFCQIGDGGAPCS